jgi:hypothetical protein
LEYKSYVLSSKCHRLGFVHAVNAFAGDLYDPAAGGFQPCQHIETGGFSGSGGSDYGNELTFIYIKGNAVQGIDFVGPYIEDFI